MKKLLGYTTAFMLCLGGLVSADYQEPTEQDIKNADIVLDITTYFDALYEDVITGQITKAKLVENFQNRILVLKEMHGDDLSDEIYNALVKSVLELDSTITDAKLEEVKQTMHTLKYQAMQIQGMNPNMTQELDYLKDQLKPYLNQLYEVLDVFYAKLNTMPDGQAQEAIQKVLDKINKKLDKLIPIQDPDKNTELVTNVLRFLQRMLEAKITEYY